MDHVERSIEVDAPISKVYNQWTQFEEFPHFMAGVERVKQLGDKRLQWRAEIGGKVVEWEAEIFEQIPDKRIAWRSTTGAMNTGMVSFDALSPNRTLVCVKLNYTPGGAMEKIGSALGVVASRVEGDLERFKEFIEGRGAETGGWRGKIEGRNVQSSGTSDVRTQTPAAAESLTGAEPRSKRQVSTEIPAPLRSMPETPTPGKV
jgi:uncharacterized membrane protein